MKANGRKIKDMVGDTRGIQMAMFMWENFSSEKLMAKASINGKTANARTPSCASRTCVANIGQSTRNARNAMQAADIA